MYIPLHQQGRLFGFNAFFSFLTGVSWGKRAKHESMSSMTLRVDTRAVPALSWIEAAIVTSLGLSPRSPSCAITKYPQTQFAAGRSVSLINTDPNSLSYTPPPYHPGAERESRPSSQFYGPILPNALPESNEKSRIDGEKHYRQRTPNPPLLLLVAARFSTPLPHPP